MEKNDKEIQQTAPQQQGTWSDALADTYGTILEDYGSLMQSNGDVYAQKRALREQREADIAATQQAYTDALANHRSVMNTLLKRKQPVYDANKEKRLRNNAIINSFGDLMSEVTKGAFAFNKHPKSGAGVYIPRDNDYALKDINEINRMREEYAQRNEAWRNLGDKIELDDAAAKVEAAEALRTQAVSDAEGAREAEDEALQNLHRSAKDYAGTQQKMATNLANLGQREKAAAEAAARRRSQSSTKSGNGSNKPDSTAQNIAMQAAVYYAWKRRDDDYIYSDVWKDERGRELNYYTIDDNVRRNIYDVLRNQVGPQLLAIAVMDGTPMYDAYKKIEELSSEQQEKALEYAKSSDDTLMEIIEEIKKGEQ
jgi:hypothetical protein